MANIIRYHCGCVAKNIDGTWIIVEFCSNHAMLDYKPSDEFELAEESLYD